MFNSELMDVFKRALMCVAIVTSCVLLKLLYVKYRLDIKKGLDMFNSDLIYILYCNSDLIYLAKGTLCVL